MDTTTHAPTEGAFTLFREGMVGQLHLAVHRWVDEDAIERAASTLRLALEERPPSLDPDWVHLHWHQLVLDSALGRWGEARRRFLTHVLPAVGAGRARTDAPSGLWVLALDAPVRRPVLPWAAVAAVARANLDEPDPFLALHDALALAGARDEPALGAWIARRAEQRDSAIRDLAEGLAARLRGDRAKAARLLGSAWPALHRLPGSPAQLSLLRRIALGVATRS